MNAAADHPPDDGPAGRDADGPAGRITALWTALSLRERLLAILLVLLLAALAATGYGVQLVLRGYLVGQIDHQLLATAAASRDDRFLNSLIEQDRQRFPSPFVVQPSLDGEPNPAPVSGMRHDSPLPDFPSVTSQRAATLVGKAYTVRADDGSSWRATTFPVSTSEIPSRAGSVTILQDLSGVDAALARLRLLTAAIGAAVLAACAVLGWLAIRRAFVPLRVVEDTAEAIAAGDLSRRVPERPTRTEVGRLTSSLNGMLTQIEGAFRDREASEARTRRFAADASHELRTPLASIRGYAELYRQGAVPTEEVPRTMRRIEDEATRMGGLVEDLLLLARLDEQRPARAEPVDLLVLAGDAVHDVRALDPERRVRLTGLTEPGTASPTSPERPSSPRPAPVIGDEDRLRQVVGNLLGNAVRHTPPGSPIEVAVGVDGAAGRDVAVLEVRDHGPGLTSEQAERVFERFYRADPSRRRWRPDGAEDGAAHRPGGTGLGLSIVDAVVTAHGGRIAIRETPGGGATFVVSLPATSLEDASPPAP